MVFIASFILWIVCFLGFHVMGWYIHVLLVLGIAALVVQLMGGIPAAVWLPRRGTGRSF
jgi:Family of unknown function (DUF5670)